MTRGTYEFIESEALRILHRLLNICSGENIAFIMSQDIFDATLIFANEIQCAIEYSDGIPVGTHSVYRGYDIFFVNEESGTIFKPAIKGFKIMGFDYHNLNYFDYILSDSDGEMGRIHVFAKSPGEPTQFADIGITVRREREYSEHRRVTFADRLRGVSEFNPSQVIGFNSATDVFNNPPYWLRSPLERGQASFTDDYNRYAGELERQLYAAFSSVMHKPVKTVPKNWDETLTDESTKELDEFLNSFAIAESVLSPAT